MAHRYNSYADSLIKKYGHKVFRVGIDAGFSCPNRCKSPTGQGCTYCDSLGAKAAYLRTRESGYTHQSGFERNIDSMAQSEGLGENYVFVIDKEDIERQVKRGIEFVQRRYKVEHFSAYLQSFSNTFAPVEKLKELYDYVLSLYAWDEFIISTRPDCLDAKKLDLIEGYKEGREVCVELGLQSGDDNILQAMRRGHDVGCFVRAAKAVKARGISLCVHVLVGYPGEGKEQMDKTIAVLGDVHPDAVKIHNLNVVAGTALFEDFLGGEVIAPSMPRYIERVIYVLRRIPSDIVVERLLCETPSHRLASPRLFADKNQFLATLDTRMDELDVRQGDLVATCGF